MLHYIDKVADCQLAYISACTHTGIIAAYNWSAPAALLASAMLVDGEAAVATLTVDVAAVEVGTYVLYLTVLDDQAEPDTAKLSLVVTSCPAGHRSFDAYTCMPIPPPAFPPLSPPSPLPSPPSPHPPTSPTPSSPPPCTPPLPPTTPHLSPPSSWCFNDCNYAEDGACDDGGPSSGGNGCQLGHDCADCGLREIKPPSPPPPLPPPPSPPPSPPSLPPPLPPPPSPPPPSPPPSSPPPSPPPLPPPSQPPPLPSPPPPSTT